MSRISASLSRRPSLRALVLVPSSSLLSLFDSNLYPIVLLTSLRARICSLFHLFLFVALSTDVLSLASNVVLSGSL
jgi:hypothetical protein